MKQSMMGKNESECLHHTYLLTWEKRLDYGSCSFWLLLRVNIGEFACKEDLCFDKGYLLAYVRLHL